MLKFWYSFVLIYCSISLYPPLLQTIFLKTLQVICIILMNQCTPGFNLYVSKSLVKFICNYHLWTMNPYLSPFLLKFSEKHRCPNGFNILSLVIEPFSTLLISRYYAKIFVRVRSSSRLLYRINLLN